jgi:transcriptional regulator
VLSQLVDHFEDSMPHPVQLSVDEEGARRIALGTVGLRLRVTRFDARLKLSQNKSPEVVDRIIDELQAGEQYANHGLAREMRRLHHGDA